MDRTKGRKVKKKSSSDEQQNKRSDFLTSSCWNILRASMRVHQGA